MTFTLTCMAGELARILTLAGNVSGHVKQVPILKACRIAVTKGMATVSATDTDHGMRATLAAEGKGEVYVEIALLAQKAAALKATEPVTMASDKEGKFLAVSQGKTRWKVPLILGDGFPVAMTEPIGGAPSVIQRRRFFAALSAVMPNIEGTDNRIFGRGPYLDMTDGFTAVAAGAKGCYVVRVDADVWPISVIIPTGSAHAMMAMFKDADEIAVTVTENAMTVDADDVMYRTKLIEGTYADWRAVVQHATGSLDGSARVGRQEMIDTIARASAIAVDGTKGAALGVRIAIVDGEMQVKASNRNGEEGYDACQADGDDGSFGVGTAKVIEALSSLTADEVELRYATDAEKPLMIRASDDDWRVVMNFLVK